MRSERSDFPFALPVLRELDQLALNRPITFFVGENGSGKSTLLEAIALLCGCVAMGSDDLERDPTLEAARCLRAELVAVFGSLRPRTKTFFRAEDAFGFTKRVVREQAYLAELEREFRDRYPDGSLAQQLAAGAARGQRSAFDGRYGEQPDARSHGESFLDLLGQRLVAGGLYLLDEPETPLSPIRVLALLRLLSQQADAGSQFLIATHSPILMALPGAELLHFDDGGIRPVAWEEVEHVALTRSFLQCPERYLRRL